MSIYRPTTISESGGVSLHFTKEDEDLYKKYKDAEEELAARTYMNLRYRHGAYATSRGEYVDSLDNLTQFDSLYMEKLFAKYYPELVEAESNLSKTVHNIHTHT